MKDLQVLTNALDTAIKAGVYNLQDAGMILQSINNLGRTLQQQAASAEAAKAKEPEKEEKPEKKPRAAVKKV